MQMQHMTNQALLTCSHLLKCCPHLLHQNWPLGHGSGCKQLQLLLQGVLSTRSLLLELLQSLDKVLSLPFDLPTGKVNSSLCQLVT